MTGESKRSDGAAETYPVSELVVATDVTNADDPVGASNPMTIASSDQIPILAPELNRYLVSSQYLFIAIILTLLTSELVSFPGQNAPGRQ